MTVTDTSQPHSVRPPDGVPAESSGASGRRSSRGGGGEGWGRRTVTGCRRRRLPLHPGVFVAVVTAWWAIARFAGLDPVVLPGPGQVADKLVSTNLCQASSGTSNRQECGVQGYFLWQHLLATVERIAV